MKKSPQSQKLEQMLRSSRIVAGGFMGADTRPVEEIIDADLGSLAKLGRTADEIAGRMQEITDKAIAGLGNWVRIDPYRMALVDEAKGTLNCPWPHPGRFAKRVTTVRIVESGGEITWSDLNIHLIEQHGFFEGVGSAFRLEPGELARIIF